MVKDQSRIVIFIKFNLMMFLIAIPMIIMAVIYALTVSFVMNRWPSPTLAIGFIIIAFILSLLIIPYIAYLYPRLNKALKLNIKSY